MKLHLATFRFDVTPPVGHSLCGGWITPVKKVADPLEGIGVVLLTDDGPIVLCAIDWCGVLNSAHVAWREALADAAHTSADRVALHTVHQHDAPFVCLDAEKMVSEAGDLPHVVDVKFWEECLQRSAEAVKNALANARPVTGLATGSARVERVASNRRFLNEKGEVGQWRGSSCKDPVLRDLPEGLIDPFLKTIAFYDGDEKLASLHYYATHPMSHYGQGEVSSDFCGLARKRRQAEDPGATHIYFTGCAGNIAAGKYNDGSPQARIELTDRMYAALVSSEKDLRPQPIKQVRWATEMILPPARAAEEQKRLEEVVGRKDQSAANRIRPAMELTWARRSGAKAPPIVISALHLDQTSLLHLPSECFIEYQLRTQENYPERFVATAAYGDGGPWYIPVEPAFPQGGYEVSVAFCTPRVDQILSDAIRKVMD